MSIVRIGVTAPGVAASRAQTPRRSRISRAPCDSASERSPPQRRARRARVERDDVEVGVGERQRERAADGPGADDDDVVQHRVSAGRPLRRRRPIFGAAAVRFSCPVAVTSTSSSMRTPMFQKCSGTLSAGRMYVPGSTVSTMPGASFCDAPFTW